MRAPRPIRIVAFYLLVAGIVLESIFPFYYAVVTSFKSGQAIFQVDYWPSSFSLGNYAAVLGAGHFARNILNSLIVAVATVALSLALGVTASYALARIRFRGRRLLLFTILSVSMFPQVAVLAGLFEMVSAFRLYNSLLSLVFAYLIFTLPFTVWVLTAFMRDLPAGIEEAAIMDGASPFAVVTRIFMPMLWPAMVTTGLLAFITAWNEFLFALTFISTDTQRTVPVAIALLSGASSFEVPWGRIMAASVIVTVPLIVLVLVFQRRIVAGLTAGGVKG
jgi:trehalose/maltose transport system permease protein